MHPTCEEIAVCVSWSISLSFWSLSVFFVKVLLVSLTCDKVVGLFVNCLLSGTNTISGRYQLRQFGKGEELEKLTS